TFQNHTDCPLTDFGGKTSIFSHPVYLFLRKFSLQDSRGGSIFLCIPVTYLGGLKAFIQQFLTGEQSFLLSEAQFRQGCI
ncbi:hypothetical protein, partial [Escherichia coli]